MGRLRSVLAAPAGARLLGIAFALAGVALLVLGVFAFGGGSDPSGAAPSTAPSVVVPSVTATTAAPTASATPPPSAPATSAPTAAPTSQLPATTPPPATTTAPVRVPLTVLNNSTIRGLGERAAAQARAKGWQVASIGNFAGVIPVTTVYYTPGSAAEETAARRLQADLPQVSRVLPRYEGLPPTPTGVVLVVTRDWS